MSKLILNIYFVKLFSFVNTVAHFIFFLLENTVTHMLKTVFHHLKDSLHLLGTLFLGSDISFAAVQSDSVFGITFKKRREPRTDPCGAGKHNNRWKK